MNAWFAARREAPIPAVQPLLRPPDVRDHGRRCALLAQPERASSNCFEST
jgi:hypothetical protein